MRVSAMHLDAGYDEASLMFLGDALSMAQQVDDPTLTAWVLSRRGEYELDMAARARCDHADSAYAAHIDKAVDYMGGATRMARKAPPVAQAFIRAKEALAWSMAGDRVETERALGLMWDSYADAGRRPEPGWMNAYGGANLQHEAARCYCNVGMGEHAIRAAEDSLSTRTARRPRAFSLGMLAIGHAQAGNVRGACGFARELLESAASLGSFRVLVRMAEVVRALSPYRHDPDVTELRAAAQPVLCSLDR